MMKSGDEDRVIRRGWGCLWFGYLEGMGGKATFKHPTLCARLPGYYMPSLMR